MNDYEFQLCFYHNITPLHIGCGQDVGIVDLPVIRERSTSFPFIPGSGTRGVLRDIFEEKYGKNGITEKLFGPPPESMDPDSIFAGSIAVHDARILLFPVRTNKKIFCWITSPLVLNRFNRDIREFGINLPLLSFNPNNLSDLSDAKFVGPADFGNSLHLEEFLFQRNANNEGLVNDLNVWASRIVTNVDIEDLNKRVLLVSDKSFAYFVNYATMLMQHNTLTSSKTVKGGALFSVESIPPETIFYGMLGCTNQRKEEATKWNKAEVLNQLKAGLFSSDRVRVAQLGGDEGTGLGVTRIVLAQ